MQEQFDPAVLRKQRAEFNGATYWDVRQNDVRTTGKPTPNSWNGTNWALGVVCSVKEEPTVRIDDDGCEVQSFKGEGWGLDCLEWLLEKKVDVNLQDHVRERPLSQSLHRFCIDRKLIPIAANLTC